MKILKNQYTKLAILLFIIFNISSNTCLAEEAVSSILNINTDKSEFFSNNFSFAISGKTDSENINLVEINLVYNQNDLFFDSLDITSGFCEFLIYQTIDQEIGEINFACATSKATSTLNIAKINFTKINSGFTSLNLADSKFYPNNGLGESILPDTETFSYFLFK